MEKRWISLSLLIVLCLSCLQETDGGKRLSVETSSGAQQPQEPAEPPPGTPPGGDKNIHFQDGPRSYYTQLIVEKGMDRAIFLKGEAVHLFLEDETRRDGIFCLVAHFDGLPGGTNETLILRAAPRSYRAFEENTREFYFLLHPNREASNKVCQEASLLSALDRIHGNSTLRFGGESLCPSCNELEMTSTALGLYQQDGTEVGDIEVTGMNIKITNRPPTELQSLACEGSNDCGARGYDCCLQGQCVEDKSVKNSVDQSNGAFQEAHEQVSLLPALVSDYIHFYNVCPQRSESSIESIRANSDDDFDPVEEAHRRMTEKKELYECVNPTEGGISHCTVTYPDREAGEQGLGGVSFYTGTDDLNFEDTYSGVPGGIPSHSIHKITYGGVSLFENDSFLQEGFTITGIGYPFSGGAIQGNNSLTEALRVIIMDNLNPPGSGSSEEIKITYRIDGSCVRINDSLAKCERDYVQGQNLGKITDHFPSTRSFLLPFYAETTETRPVRVSVDGVPKVRGAHWDFSPENPREIRFKDQSETQHYESLYNTQKIKLSFYVDLNIHDVLQKIEESRDRIRALCDCVGEECNLKPQSNDDGQVVDYACDYPEVDRRTLPFFETFFISAKTVPVRYFDEGGAPHSKIDDSTPPQEGIPFAYENGNLDRPNNRDNYVGFNEVYGSLDHTNFRGAVPAKEIALEKGKVYNIFTERNTNGFSSCLFCGNDYWNRALSFFPRNFTDKGGGYVPNFFQTDPLLSRTYRKDDLLFGRACFVPVTMIPWTHRPHMDRQIQRMNRQQAQHFLFANGLQRDWYGFDYGSLIGSWNGVVWFSIGNQRRVRAKSHRLFLAINAYWGDLTETGDFTVTVQEDVSLFPDSGSVVSHDFESDGAECQKYHTCETDRDCVAKLGWDYACESIVSLKSSWPEFDVYGMEIPGTEKEQSLRSMFNQSRGPSNRCVYRGRGSLCHKDYADANSEDTFNRSTISTHLVCSANNYCQSFEGREGVNSPLVREAKFNTKISRYGQSVIQQNNSPHVEENDLDSFGLHARYLGRPMKWNGTEVIPRVAQENLSHNVAEAMCVPGREPASTFTAMNNTEPTSVSHRGDRSLGIGMTEDLRDDNYFAACPVLDSSGSLVHFRRDDADTSLFDGMTFISLAAKENSSTNALRYDFLEEAANLDVINDSHVPYADFDSEQVTRPNLELNRCLRMPGATCHSDNDCVASSLITDVSRIIDPADVPLNAAELSFWQETLVCSQKSDVRNSYYSLEALQNLDYDLGKNRCCRELGKKLTVASWVEGSTDLSPLIPGHGIPMDSNQRYSLHNVVNDLVAEEGASVALEAPGGDDCDSPGCVDKESDMDYQYRIFPKIPERICCNGDWIREFHEDNQGDNGLDAERHQMDFDLEAFRCYNWIDKDDQADLIGGTGQNEDFTCKDSESVRDLDCGARSVPEDEAREVLTWLSNLELTGIPQVIMAAPFTNSNHPLHCTVNPADQTAPTGLERIIPNVFVLRDSDSDGTLDDTALREIEDNDGNRYYSLGDMSNFDGEYVKQVFSPDKVRCCIPAGEKVPKKNPRETPDQSKCCTGYIDPSTERCALRDYTNVSVYFNRFVSSGAKGLSEDMFDTNGFIESPVVVEQLACQKSVCASGVVARGVAWSYTRIPGQSRENDLPIRQFLDSENRNEDNFNGLVSLFKAGLKWNNHVYCVPSNIDTSAPELTAFKCVKSR